MGLIREPKNVDFTVQSELWTEEEHRDFRILMNRLKAKNQIKKLPVTANKKKKILA